MKKVLTAVLAALLGAFLLFFVLSYMLEFRPDAEMPVSEINGRDGGLFALPDTLKIMTWNIGYAGLGDNMDFIVDGGQMVRDTKERTQDNLADIIARLKKENADIYLLQEVDLDSHRTYGINELATIAGAFPDYLAYYAPCFKVWFVPVPLREPMGRMDCGQLILTKVKPFKVTRVQYPSSFSFPTRMFNLKRCLLEADFRTESGTVVHLGNTHCTAFDTGTMRKVEIDFLKDRLSAFNAKGEAFIIGGDWNQNPPQYEASREELENKYFSPVKLDTSGIASFTKVLCDTTCYSMRYNDRPFSSTSTKSILDFFLVTKDSVSELEYKTIDLNFKSSDHNPVTLKTTWSR